MERQGFVNTPIWILLATRYMVTVRGSGSADARQMQGVFCRDYGRSGSLCNRRTACALLYVTCYPFRLSAYVNNDKFDVVSFLNDCLVQNSTSILIVSTTRKTETSDLSVTSRTPVNIHHEWTILRHLTIFYVNRPVTRHKSSHYWRES